VQRNPCRPFDLAHQHNACTMLARFHVKGLQSCETYSTPAWE
jgi:hypothetical protein